MSLTYGFYNSVNGDRKYYAEEMSRIFDGIIKDGIFASIGKAFAVTATTGKTLNVAPGKAWFNHTWTLNDSDLLIEAPGSSTEYDRIDALVIEINSGDAVRANSIKFVTGSPTTNPQRPTLTNTETVHQYPLCYIYRAKGSVEITTANITSMIGTESTPFITGILQTVDLNVLLGQWQDQLNKFILLNTSKFNSWMTTEEYMYNKWKEEQETDYETWITNHKTDYDQWVTEQRSLYESEFESILADLQYQQSLLENWMYGEKADFTDWYNEMKDQLSEDAAGNLQLQIDREEIERILISGFVDGSKVVSEDGTVITSTASDGRVLTKTFTDNFKKMTTVLTSSAGAEIARLVKNFGDNGSSINTTVTYA